MVNVFYYIYHTIKHRLLYNKIINSILLGNCFFIFEIVFTKHIFFLNIYEEFESGLLKFKFTHISNV